MKSNKTFKRVFYIDLIRGLCVLLMIGDHFMFDCAYILPKLSSSPFVKTIESAGLFYWYNSVRLVVRGIVMSTFYLLCGISTSLSRNNLNRVLKLFIVCVGLTIVTYTFDAIFGYQGFVVWFGTLHMLTVAILLTVLIEFIKNEKIKTVIYLSSASIMIILHAIFFDPNRSGIFAGLIGIGYPSFQAGDTVGIMPFVGIVFIGVVVGKLLKRKRLLKPSAPPTPLRPACFVGRYALLTYILHQPLLLIIILLFSLF